MRLTEIKNQTPRMKLSSYQQHDGTVYNLVLPFNDFSATVDEIPTAIVNPNLLLATQTWIDSIHGGGGDSVMTGLNKYPLVVKTKDGKMHILDGHHRVNSAIERGDDKIKIYLAPINI